MGYVEGQEVGEVGEALWEGTREAVEGEVDGLKVDEVG